MKRTARRSAAHRFARSVLDRLAPAAVIALSVTSTEALADRVRWTLQSVPATTEHAAALETRLATMTWGEMRLKAFEPNALSAANDLYRSVSIGAVDAALVDEATWADALDAPPEAVALTRDGRAPASRKITTLHRLRTLREGMGALRERLRRDDVFPVLCGMHQAAESVTEGGGFSLLLIHLPHHRRLDKSQKAILDTGCAAAVLNGLAPSGITAAD